jgi:hypothetical protein
VVVVVAVVVAVVQEDASSPSHAIHHSPVAPSHEKIHILRKDPAKKSKYTVLVPTKTSLLSVKIQKKISETNFFLMYLV